MSIHFYSKLNDNTPLAILDINSMTSYANEHKIKYKQFNDYTLFVMDWKSFYDMALRHMPRHCCDIHPQFIEIKNTPEHRVIMTVANQENPLQLTVNSGRNVMTPDILQIPDHTPVDIIFDYSTTNNYPIEHFGMNNSTCTFKNILWIILLILVVYFVYHIYQNNSELN